MFTGRTGHWLNHSKEHCLVAYKKSTTGRPLTNALDWLNRGLDTDVIVAEVRETSRKPDELYELIERACPGGRKLGKQSRLPHSTFVHDFNGRMAIRALWSDAQYEAGLVSIGQRRSQSLGAHVLTG